MECGSSLLLGGWVYVLNQIDVLRQQLSECGHCLIMRIGDIDERYLRIGLN